jgi:hypothetical protein
VAGRVRSVCRGRRRRGGFSHVVGYASSSPLGAVVVDTLLNAQSHVPAGWWHPGLLVPAGRPGPTGPTRHPSRVQVDLRVRDPRLSFKFSSGTTVMVFRALAPAQGPAESAERDRAQPGPGARRHVSRKTSGLPMQVSKSRRHGIASRNGCSGGPRVGLAPLVPSPNPFRVPKPTSIMIENVASALSAK